MLKARYSNETQFSRYLSNWFETYIHIKTCMCMFIVGLFIIANYWKNPRCPSMIDTDCMKRYRLQCIQPMNYYSATEISDLSNHKKTWMNLQCILLNERSQYGSNHTTFWKRQGYRDSIHISVCQGFGSREDQTGGTWEDYLKQQNYSVWYCKGKYKTLSICWKPRELYKSKP